MRQIILKSFFSKLLSSGYDHQQIADIMNFCRLLEQNNAMLFASLKKPDWQYKDIMQVQRKPNYEPLTPNAVIYSLRALQMKLENIRHLLMHLKITNDYTGNASWTLAAISRRLKKLSVPENIDCQIVA